MKRRLLAILLILTMALGLASCGSKGSNSKDASLSAVIDKMSDMGTGKSEITVDIDTDILKAQQVPFSKLGLKITSQIDKDNEKVAKADISYKLDTDEFTKLTTIIVDDQVIYVNLKELKTAAASLIDKLGLGQYQSILAAIPEAEYVKVDPATLSQLGAAVEVAPSSDVKISMEDMKKFAKIGTEIAKVVEEAVKDVNPAVISGSGDEVSVSLNDKNAKAALEALAKADYSKCFDNVMKQMESISIGKDIVTKYVDKKDTVLKELKSGLESAAAEIAKAKDFSFDYSVKIDGSKGERTADTKFVIDLKDSEQYLKATVSGKTEEGTKETIEVPSDATDFMQLMSSLMSGAGALGGVTE